MTCIVHDAPFRNTPLDRAAAICLSHAYCNTVANSTGALAPQFLPAFTACDKVWKTWLAQRWERYHTQSQEADAARDAADAIDKRFVEEFARGLK